MKSSQQTCGSCIHYVTLHKGYGDCLKTRVGRPAYWVVGCQYYKRKRWDCMRLGKYKVRIDIKTLPCIGICLYQDRHFDEYQIGIVVLCFEFVLCITPPS